MGVLVLLLVLAAPVASAESPRNGGPPAAVAEDPLAQLGAAIAEQLLTVENLTNIRHRMLTKPLSGTGMISVADLVDGIGGAEPGFRTLVPVRVGDLDLDGRDDVLVVAGQHFHALDLVLEARDGAEGSLLWSHALRFDALIAPSDLNGDGVVDVVVFEPSATLSESGLPVTPGPSTLQRLTLLDGRDGSPSWTAWIPAASVSAGVADPFFTSTSVTAVAELVLGVTARSDADGDGLMDVHLDLISFVGGATGVGIPFTAVGGYAAAAHFSYTALTISGSDGSEIGRATILTPLVIIDAITYCTVCLGIPIPFSIPAPDLSGDGLGDLVAFGTLDLAGSGVRAMSVAGVPYWNVPVGQGWVRPEILRSVETADVLVKRFDSVRSVFEHRLHAGHSGALRWTFFRPGSSSFATLTDDLDGDGWQDLLFSWYVSSWPPTGMAEAYSGVDATSLWTFSHRATTDPLLEAAIIATCACGGDLDGDGLVDLLFEEIVQRRNTTQVVRRSFGAASSATRTELWFATVRGPLAIAGGDVDGDGTHDVFMFDTGEPSVQARSGSSLSLLWEHPLSVPAPLFVRAALGADIAGDAGLEVILSTGLGALEAVGAEGVLWTL